MLLLPHWIWKTFHADQYARPAEWGSNILHKLIIQDHDSTVRQGIFARQRERARISLINLVDAFLGDAAKVLVEDALDMIEAAAAQRDTDDGE